MPHSAYWPFATRAADNVNVGESSVLEQHLGDMEGEVQEIRMELAAIRRDRLDLYNRKQSKTKALGLISNENAVTKDIDSFVNFDKICKEKCQSNPPEILKLREELIRARNQADEERFQRVKYEDKLKDLEQKLNSLCCIGSVVESYNKDDEKPRKLEEENSSLKHQLRDLKEEMEEMKISNTEQAEQLQEYRMKYIQAQQEVEEYKRQLDILDFDNKQVSDQIQIEIQKMKMQFQEKLQELSPLPDLLKGAQIQLQEAKELQKLAEDSSQQLSHELHRVKEKLVIACNGLSQEKIHRAKCSEDKEKMRATIDEKNREIDETRKTLDEFKCKLLRLSEQLAQQEQRNKEKSSECSQLLKDLDELRQENSRSHQRGKERSDSMRRYLQTQISELERQLIQSRAQHRACQKERDEIRQRMQIQINHLQENFELVEIRLRGLLTQVASLKNSYSVILADEDDSSEFKIVNQ